MTKYESDIWRRLATPRASLAAAVVGFRVSAFLCVCVRSLQEASGNAALIVAVLNNLVLLFMLGLFLREWRHSWPGTDGSLRVMSQFGKGVYLFYMIFAAQVAALAAMAAMSTAEIDSVALGIYMTLEFLSNSLAQFIAIDAFADRGISHAIALTEKRAAKDSGDEFEAHAAQLELKELGK